MPLNIGTIYNLNSVEKRHKGIEELDLDFESIDDMKEYLNGDIVAVVLSEGSDPIFLRFDQDFPAIKNREALEEARKARLAKSAQESSDEQVPEQLDEQAA